MSAIASFPQSHKGRSSSNSRTNGSAAAFARRVGVRQVESRGEGSLRDFCADFNVKAEAWLESRSPECRAFAKAERQAKVIYGR